MSPPIIRGTRVEFEADDGLFYRFPETWGLVVQKKRHHTFVYVVPWRFVGSAHAPARRKLTKEAQLYYGDESQVREVAFDLPAGPWHATADVVAVQYARFGHLSGWYRHEFKFEQSLERCADRARLVLPWDAVVNEGGFKWP